MSQPIPLFVDRAAIIKDIAGRNWQQAREHIMQAAEDRGKELASLPPGSDLMYPWPHDHRFVANEAGMRWWQNYNTPKKERTFIRPAERCMMLVPFSEPHRCFQPEGKVTEIKEFYVLFYEPLSPQYLPSREFQPEWIRREYRCKFCCLDAALIFAQQLGDKVDVRLSNGDEDRTVSQVEESFFGAQPCWK